MANTVRIYKTKQSEELDEHFSGSADQLRGIYTTALHRYEEYDDQPLTAMVTDLAGQAGVPWSAFTAEYFANEWVSGKQSRSSTDAVLRNGYREAIRLALSHEPPVPLETFWVTGAGADFEVQISDGEEHVTLFTIVPGVAGDDIPLGSKRAVAKSWIVTAGERTPDEGRPEAEQLGTGEVLKLEISGKARTAH